MTEWININLRHFSFYTEKQLTRSDSKWHIHMRNRGPLWNLLLHALQQITQLLWVIIPHYKQVVGKQVKKVHTVLEQYLERIRSLITFSLLQCTELWTHSVKFVQTINSKEKFELLTFTFRYLSFLGGLKKTLGDMMVLKLPWIMW